MTLFWLLYIHFTINNVLESRFIKENKKDEFFWMLSNCVIWSGTILLFLSLFNNVEDWKFLFLFIGYYLINKWKNNQKPLYTWIKPFNKKYIGIKNLYIAQFLHIIQLIIVWIF